MFSEEGLWRFSTELSADILACSSLHFFAAGSVILEPGQSLDGVYLLKSGMVKLFRVHSSAERHLMYMLTEESLCALSSLTGLLGEESSVLAFAEEDVEFLVVPKAQAMKWFLEREEWRKVLLSSFLDGWKESMAMLDEVSFKPLKRRLEKYLARHSALSNRSLVKKSHAEIATELNVSREAISRVLKMMENDDLIHLGHGSIKVIHANP